jgi:hypothetical protein
MIGSCFAIQASEMLGCARRSSRSATLATSVLRYRSAEHFVDVFKTYYGPMLKAFAALDQAGQNGLREDLHALIALMNRANDGTMVVPSEYLEVVVTKR